MLEIWREDVLGDLLMNLYNSQPDGLKRLP